MVDDIGKPFYRSISSLEFYRDFLFVEEDGYWRGTRNTRNMTQLFAIQEYPAPMWKSLYWLVRAALFFTNRDVAWGWSSHTTGYADCVMAARMGASVIEKHFAMGPQDVEAPHSLLPDEFGKMVERIRKI